MQLNGKMLQNEANKMIMIKHNYLLKANNHWRHREDRNKCMNTKKFFNTTMIESSATNKINIGKKLRTPGS